MILTRPPVVFVHGINSDPYNAWEGSGGMAQTLQKQGYIITTFSFADHSGTANDYGSGPLTSDWQCVQNAVGATIEDFRYGLVNYSIYNPDTPTGDPTLKSTGLAEGTLIAVQKVDVVAHSYGGLLTRWYMEQATDPSGGKLFEDFRNIRSLVEIGTPNLGSPLANMVDAIYSNTTIGSAQLDSGLVDFFHDIPFISPPTNMLGFLQYLQKNGKLFSSFPNSTNPLPFYEDDAVNSPLLEQLNAPGGGENPFNGDVGYAAIYGVNPDLPVQKVLGVTLFLDVYPDMQPMNSNDQSYFPWINTLDGAANDSIVPTWSARLPDLNYDKPVKTDHIDLESNAATELDVINFLSNPNLPLGSAEAAAAGSSGWTAPTADQNVYDGGSNINRSGTEVSGAGLNPSYIENNPSNSTNQSAVALAAPAESTPSLSDASSKSGATPSGRQLTEPFAGAGSQSGTAEGNVQDDPPDAPLSRHGDGDGNNKARHGSEGGTIVELANLGNTLPLTSLPTAILNGGNAKADVVENNLIPNPLEGSRYPLIPGTDNPLHRGSTEVY